MTNLLRPLLLPSLFAGVLAATASQNGSSVARSPVRAAGVTPSAATSCPAWQRSRSWSPARVLSGRGRQFGEVTLAVAPSGEAIAAWGPGVIVSQRRAGRSVRAWPAIRGTDQ